MAGCISKFEDENFQNWIKASYAGNIAKEGLEEFVLNVISEFQQRILQESWKTLPDDKKGSLCFECLTENILPCQTKDICSMTSGKCSFHNTERKRYQACPNGICDILREEIKKNHKYGKPSWKNFSAEEWCRNPCEIGKCYLPREGYVNVTAVSDMDFNGLLNMMINNKSCDDIVDQNICFLVKDLGKRLRHSPNLLVGNRNLNEYLSALIGLLTSSNQIRNDKKASEAVANIQKLKNEPLTIIKDMPEVLQKLIEEKTRCSLRSIEDASNRCVANMEKALAIIKTSLPSGSKYTTSPPRTVTGSRKRASGMQQNTTLTKKASTLSNKQRLSTLKFLKEEEYLEMRKKFKNDLLVFNSQQNSTIPISPLFENMDAKIVDFYVLPDLYSIEVKKSKLGGSEIKYPIESLEDVFRHQNSICKEVYLIADAGLGKTAFCKYLSILWCHAHQQNVDVTENIPEGDIHALKKYDFLFFIALRESHAECDIDNMIFDLIVPRLSHSSVFSIQFLQDILHRENCLVILDGLDEWTHPKHKTCKINPKCVPHRKARDKCTILTTLRPWKLSMLNLSKSQIHHQIELNGLSSLGKAILKRKALLRVKGDGNDKLESDLIDFNAETLLKEIDDLEKVPMLLMYLVCLWCEGKPLAHSKCELYSNIVDLKLERNKQRLDMLQLSEKSQEKNGTTIKEIPECFASLKNCKKYNDILTSLGNLAFQTLFSENRERTVVFERSIVIDILDPVHFEFGLCTGILTQSEISGFFLSQKSNVSFTHKTFQEFFAALHMASAPDEDAIITKVMSVCTSIYSILEMANVLIFLSGVSKRLLKLITNKLIEVVANDDITRKYRRTESFWDYFTVEEPLKRYQDLQIACIKEHEQNFDTELHLCLQDIIIDNSCQNEKYLYTLQNLAVLNKNEIKSVNIELEGIPSLGRIMKSFKLNDAQGLEHVYLRGECDDTDVLLLLSGSVETLKSVALLSRRWHVNHFEGELRLLSHALCNSLFTMDKLESIHLNCFMAKHQDLEELLSHLGKSSRLREVIFGNVPCYDHLNDCRGLGLDLTKHTNLRTLRLHNLPLSELKINVTSLEQVSIGRLPCRESSVLSTYLSYLPDAKKLERFRCSFLDSSLDVDEILRVVALLVHLKDLRLHCINLGDRKLTLSEKMTDLQCVHLSDVSISRSGFHTLVKALMEYQQSVLVVLVNCRVGSDQDYAMIKKSIRTNEKLMVTFNGRNYWKNDEFSFRTSSICNE